MNQNIRFQTLNQEVSVFKLDVSKQPGSVELPFNFYKSYTVTRDNIETHVWACEIGDKIVDCISGDYIVIGKNTIYYEGQCKIIEDVRVMTKDVLTKFIQAYDELQEEYVDITQVFDEEINYDREPMPEEIQAIDAEVEELLKNWNVLEEDED